MVADEAHRLNAKGGLFGNLGENQIKEIIQAARCSVFFIDEDQRVTWLDIGRKAEIENWARHSDAAVTHLIEARNKVANRARMVAGYCWDWKSKADATARDVVIPEFGFSMQWNLADGAPLWMVAEGSVKQIGCIHTCQGLEADYIGVIIGPDLIARDGLVQTHPDKRSKHDKSLKGYKTALRSHPDAARSKADAIIRNTYRTLMTRGMKGCYIYCTDRETADYFRSQIAHGNRAPVLAEVAEETGIYRREEPS